MPKHHNIPINFHAPEQMKWIADDKMVKLIDGYLPLICGNRKDRYGHVKQTLREKNFPCAKWSLSFELFKHLCELNDEMNRIIDDDKAPAQEVPVKEKKLGDYQEELELDILLKRENEMLKRELEREKKLSQAYADMIDILRSQ